MLMILCETVSFPLSREKTEGELIKTSYLEILWTNQIIPSVLYKTSSAEYNEKILYLY